MKKILTKAIIFFLLSYSYAEAQYLTLNECYDLAKTNYPLIQQKELISQSKEFTIANAHSGYLPQVAIYGQATYQSAVTSIPIELPNLKITPLSKDQYRIYGELTQSLFDGGSVRRASNLEDLNARVEIQKVEVELYKIKDRINQLFFGILLLDEQIKQTELLRNDLLSSLKTVNANISNGTALPMSAQILEVELLNIKQRQTESALLRDTYLDMLGLFLHKELNPKETTLVEPQIELQTDYSFHRQELQLFDFQKQRVAKQFELSNSKYAPRLNLFIQGGFGRPALNLLKNDFSPYFIGGIRLYWNISNFYNKNRDFQLKELNSKIIDTQQSLFTFNQNLLLKQQRKEVEKLQAFFDMDVEMLNLRTKISETAKVQLENGVISVNDYVVIVNAQDKARQSLALHKIQLKMAQANIYTTLGN